MPPQAKGEIAKLSTRYWATLCWNTPAVPRDPGHDGAGEGGRRRARQGAEGVAGGVRTVPRGDATGMG